MHRIRRRNRQSVLVVSFSLSLSCTSHCCFRETSGWLRRSSCQWFSLRASPSPHWHSFIHKGSQKTSHLVESVTRIAHITANLGSSTLLLITAPSQSHCWPFNYFSFYILPLPGHHSNEALPINHCLFLRGDKPMRMCPVAGNESD